MRSRSAVPVPRHPEAAPPRRLRRTVATVATAALAVAGLAVAGVPAEASPGTSGYQEAFSTFSSTPVASVAVDSYTAQAFSARGGAVDVIDENSGSVTATVPIPGSLISHLAVDATRALVWALDGSTSTLYRIDERTNTVTASVSIAGDLRDLAVDHTTGTVFVTTGSTHTVVPVNETTAAAGTALVVGGTPTLIGVDAAEGTLYALDSTNALVSVINESTFTVTRTVAAPADAVAITVDSAHHQAYLGSPSVHYLVAINSGSNTAFNSPLPDSTLGVKALGIDPTTQTILGVQGDLTHNGGFFRFDTGSLGVNAWTGGSANDGLAGSVVSADIAVDVFTNTAVFGAGNGVFGLWEPVSFLGSLSGVVPAGAPYSKQVDVWSWAMAFPIGLAVTSGALPTGLTLSNGVISGTATTPGTYTFSLTATVPSFGDSVTQTYSLHVVTVDRTASSDRFATSVEVSKAAYPDPSKVGTVYVANGISFPDALSGGPAATQDSGPLLLTAPGYVPATVSAEITRLHPAHIVVVGGPAVVADDVLNTLKQLSPDVKRVYGGDRFGTSQAIIQHSFTTAPTVYVSTGLNFPDSLSAGGAAGSLHAPLLLVNGNATSVDPATASLLSSLHTTKIVVIGGAAVMSPALVADFARFGTVVHLAGADRFDTSQQIVATAFATSDRVLLANGLNFPDALGASAWSGSSSSALFITPGGCVPQRMLDDIYFLGATKVTLVGGTAVLGADVAALASCGGWSIIAPAYPALAPASAKTGSSAGGALAFDHPVDPSLPVNPRTHH